MKNDKRLKLVESSLGAGLDLAPVICQRTLLLLESATEQEMLDDDLLLAACRRSLTVRQSPGLYVAELDVDRFCKTCLRLERAAR